MNNMYEFIKETRNFIGGECPHKCSYCYVKSSPYPIVKERYSGKIRLFENEFKKGLGKDKFIFIGSCFDMFAYEVPKEFIKKVLGYCKKFDNTYLFQSKTPTRFFEFVNDFPDKIHLGTTIETNRITDKQLADRLGMRRVTDCVKFVTIEPIMDFTLSQLTQLIYLIKPDYVNIGADSKKSNLKEPSAKKIRELISELKHFTEVKIKSNLKRLL